MADEAEAKARSWREHAAYNVAKANVLDDVGTNGQAVRDIPRSGVRFVRSLRPDIASWSAVADLRPACTGLELDVFFPPKGDDGAAARAVCATCPVLAECLEGALDRDEEFGIWGGAGESTRRWLRRVWVDRQTDPRRWARVLGEHLARLGGVAGAPANRNGEGATCGVAATYGRGCRCDACVYAAAKRTQRDGLRSAAS